MDLGYTYVYPIFIIGLYYRILYPMSILWIYLSMDFPPNSQLFVFSCPEVKERVFVCIKTAEC